MQILLFLYVSPKKIMAKQDFDLIDYLHIGNTQLSKCQKPTTAILRKCVNAVPVFQNSIFVDKG